MARRGVDDPIIGTSPTKGNLEQGGCLRKYWYRYYGAYRGSHPGASEMKRIIYALSRVVTLPMLRGRMVHTLLAEELEYFREHGEWKSTKFSQLERRGRTLVEAYCSLSEGQDLELFFRQPRTPKMHADWKLAEATSQARSRLEAGEYWGLLSDERKAELIRRQQYRLLRNTKNRARHSKSDPVAIIWEHLFQDLQFSRLDIEERLLRGILRCLRAFWSYRHRLSGFHGLAPENIIAVEEGSSRDDAILTLPIDKDEYPDVGPNFVALNGVFDLVYFDPHHQKYVVLEWKTGKHRPEHLAQSTIYAMAGVNRWRDVATERGWPQPDLKNIELNLVYLREDPENRVQRVRFVDGATSGILLNMAGANVDPQEVIGLVGTLDAPDLDPWSVRMNSYDGRLWSGNSDVTPGWDLVYIEGNFHRLCPRRGGDPRNSVRYLDRSGEEKLHRGEFFVWRRDWTATTTYQHESVAEKRQEEIVANAVKSWKRASRADPYRSAEHYPCTVPQGVSEPKPGEMASLEVLTAITEHRKQACRECPYAVICPGAPQEMVDQSPWPLQERLGGMRELVIHQAIGELPLPRESQG